MSSNFVAIVVGDGPDLDWLYGFIDKHKLNDQVRLLGSLSIEKIKQLMVSADIFFKPSQSDGVDLSHYRAMACGLPVVAEDIDNNRKLVTPKCGVLVARSNEKIEAEKYAAVLSELLKDPQTCKNMGQASRKRVKMHFSFKKMGAKIVALLEKAMDIRKINPLTSPVSHKFGKSCVVKYVEYYQLFQLSERILEKREQAIQERISWITKQENDKSHLEGQRNHWQQVAEERERIIKTQEEDKRNLDEQRKQWQQIAEERKSMISELRNNFWVLLGLRLGFLKQFDLFSTDDDLKSEEVK